MIRNKRQEQLEHMVKLAVLTALVLVLQLMVGYVRVPFMPTPINFALIPIVLGAVLLGPLSGAWLGLVLGCTIYITLGVMGGDPLFTAILFQNHPLLTCLVCVVKSAAAGYVGGWVYRWLRGTHELLAVFLTALAVPVLNTGLFILGCFTMMDTFENNILDGVNMLYFLVVVVSGMNFVVELLVNMIFAPAVHRVVKTVAGAVKRSH